MSVDNIFSGLKVVDFASFIAGPSDAVILSDFGADVIKVEPPTGDAWRIAQDPTQAKDPYPCTWPTATNVGPPTWLLSRPVSRRAAGVGRRLSSSHRILHASDSLNTTMSRRGTPPGYATSLALARKVPRRSSDRHHGLPAKRFVVDDARRRRTADRRLRQRRQRYRWSVRCHTRRYRIVASAPGKGRTRDVPAYVLIGVVSIQARLRSEGPRAARKKNRQCP